MARPTIDDVARRVGVSKGLVSFALNDRPGVSPQTRDRILVAARELGWQPNMRARALSTNRSFALGLVLARDPGIIASDPFFPAFIAGVEQELSVVGQALVLSIVPDAEMEEATYRTLARDGRVDGVFITDLRVGDTRMALADELGLAAVTIGHPDAPSRYPAVSIDDTAGVAEAVAHLVALGHTRIAHVAGPDRLLHGARRRERVERELVDAGLRPDLIVRTDFGAAEGAEATRALLARPDRPTAIVYSNDNMAIAGLGVAQALGIRVPDELSITGFDGTEIGRHVHPALTTVASDALAWGRAAARVLLDALAGREVADVELPAARLVTRGSTTRPPLEPAP